MTSSFMFSIGSRRSKNHFVTMDDIMNAANRSMILQLNSLSLVMMNWMMMKMILFLS
jgi:hypothetical protein